MEDAHFAMATLEGLGGHDWHETSVFGVLDGHGGKEVARFCKEHLPRAIAQGPHKDTHNALISAYHRMDELLGSEGMPSGSTLRSYSDSALGTSFFGGGSTPNTSADWMGCTSVVVLVEPYVIVVANAGDSRAVLSRGQLAVPLSED